MQTLFNQLDAAHVSGENLFGHNVHYEPTGPNTPLAKSASGQELYPGPGDNAFVDRPANCVAQTVPSQPAGTCLLGGGSNPPGARRHRDRNGRQHSDHRQLDRRY